jgi:alkylation response protein AidB-like acyl-CoA dehydrogenase
MAQAQLNETPDTETIDLLRDSAADFCARSLQVARLRDLRGATPAFERDAWQQMCELGWSGILVPEEYGGLAMGATAIGAVCRQLGRVVAPEPMLECGVIATALLSRLPRAAALMNGLVSGDKIIAVGLAGDDEFPGRASTPLRASSVGDKLTLNGCVRAVALADSCDGLVVTGELNSGEALFYLARNSAGLTIESRPQADGSSASSLIFESVVLAGDALLATGADADQALAHARCLAQLATSAYLVGLAEQVFEVTLEYLRTREQFGRAIGTFQALQHRAVDLYIQKTLAIAVLDEALATYDASDSMATRQRAASRAKYRANEAALVIARQAVQLHGGMGYTDECDVGLYLNRALVLSARHGTSAYHVRGLGALLERAEAVDAPAPGGVAAPLAAPANGEWDSVSDETFRAIVRQFFETEYPVAQRFPSRRPRWAEIKSWYLTLSAKGWVAPAWPAEYGGMGLSPAKMLIYIEEQERCGIGRAPDMGIQMVGPLLIRHGTSDQRARFLPKILAGETVWCQGYSEPNAGSDLASLKTEAIADGDEFVINGQKTWTTLAQDATHMFCLARTSKEGKQQEGISFFLIDFDQPGITIRPIRNIAGDEEFCEVFLDNVRVPADCLVGEINQGWTIAKALLGFERIFIGSPKQSQNALMRLEAIAEGTGLYDDPVFCDKLTRFKLDVLDLETTYQVFAAIVRRGETLGPDVSLLKIWGTETFAKLSETMVETAGAEGATRGKLSFGDGEVDVMSQFYNARPATIYGGSNEIQRNIIAKGVLRLPS